ncbi:MAG: HEPN domain-containing protein [candidate division WS1 bacterium]|jgi:uncharacterized protein (UPF0332 family)|nr:HEPN domain-containing protein [candidate division WS1 bacterium]
MNQVEREQAERFMARAQRTLDAADYELQGGFVPDAISSSYYATLYAAKALLATRGLVAHRHSAVLRLLGREFVEPGDLGKENSRVIGVLLESRISADYDAAPPFTANEAEEHLAQARDFVSASSALLDTILHCD